jgi:hypothetical protein
MRESVLLVPAALLVVVAVLLPTSRGVQPGGPEAVAQRDGAAAPKVQDPAEAPPAAPEETAATLLARFFAVLPRQVGESLNAPLIDLVAAEADRQGYDVDNLVVLLPDPIDSHSRWLFDPIQEALQRAAAANTYALDRFYVPDWRPGHTAAVRMGRLHESWPGVILFRQQPGTDTGHRILVTFLVFETPTQGVHLGAFREAVRFVHEWNRAVKLVAEKLGKKSAEKPGEESPLKILGPTFSGSSPSLRIALRDAERRKLLPSRVRVISGSATNPDNKPIIENAVPVEDGAPKRVTFEATVLSSHAMLEGVVEHLKKLSGVKPREMALLVEQNTAYGQAEYRPPGQETALEGAMKIGFPLHISRIRATASGRDRDDLALLRRTPKTQALSLKEEGPVIDQLPMFGESTSSAYVELLLLNTLETLRREHITTVGLLATDTRDKLFLSQMLARHCPNMRVFTIETDLLFAHPDYSTYMRGMIVASTYPLFNANQLWTQPSRGERWRFQFGASFTIGLFNAFQALIKGDSLTVADLVEYASPLETDCPKKCASAVETDCTQTCAPPLWISVNGNTGLWPLDVVGIDADGKVVKDANDKVGRDVDSDVGKAVEGKVGKDDVKDKVYTLRVADVSEEDKRKRTLPSRARMRPVPMWATVTLIALHLGAWLQLIAYLTGFVRPAAVLCPAPMARPFMRDENPRPDANQRRYLLAAFVALLLLLVSADLLWIWAWDFSGNTHTVKAAVFSGVTILAVLGALANVAWRRLPPLVSALLVKRPSAFAVRMSAYRVIYLGLLAVMSGFLFMALYDVAKGLLEPKDVVRQQQMLFLFNRTVDLGNGVSPAVPILLFCSALYLWGFQHFRTRGVPSRSTLKLRLAELKRMRSRPAPFDHTAAPVMPGPSTSDSFASLRLTVLLAVLVLQVIWYVGLPGMPGVTTIESAAYTRFFQVGSMLLQALVAVSIAQFLFAWSRTRRGLERFVDYQGFSGPLQAAFARLPRGIRRVGVFARVPKLEELEDAVAASCAVAASMKLAGLGQVDGKCCCASRCWGTMTRSRRISSPN